MMPKNLGALSPTSYLAQRLRGLAVRAFSRSRALRLGLSVTVLAALCAVVLRAALGNEETGTLAEAAAVPGHLEWPTLSPPGAKTVEVDEMGRWMAAVGYDGRLVVRALVDELALGEVLLDTGGREFAVERCEWAGAKLLYQRVDGVTDYRAYLLSPPENWPDYLAEHEWVWAWDTATGQEERVASGYRVEAMLGSPRSERFALFRRDDGQDLALELYSVLDLSLISRATLGLPALFRKYLPCYWSSDEEHVFALAETDPPEGFPLQVLVCTDVHGKTQWLSNATDRRLWGKDFIGVRPPTEVLAPGSLNVCSLREGDAVACTLTPGPGGREFRLGMFGTQGLVGEHPLEREWCFGPPELRGGPHPWTWTVSITPDGEQLLLQEQPRAGDSDGPWLWAWDFRKREGHRLVQLPHIEQVPGWIGSEHVVVRCGPPPGEPYYVREFRVVHVPTLAD